MNMRTIVNMIGLVAVAGILSCNKSSSAGGGAVGGGSNPPPVSSHLYVNGTTLKDGNGNAFIMRGNNFPVFWFPNEYKPAIAAAASLRCNTARLVWETKVEAWTPPLSKLDEALATCIANKMVPIVELHDFTGGNNVSDINIAAGYFVRPDVKAILDKYSHVLMINIANEWGSGATTDEAWRNAYLQGIYLLRNAGYKVPIVIDAPGYGQRETAIVNFGQELLNSDPLKNIVFSVHAYSNWNVSTTYGSRINNLLAKNLCIIFGEFGWNVPDSQQPTGFTCKVDAPLLMQWCKQTGIGYLGWSWNGNSPDNACFDMCRSWSDTAQLTTWGRQWAYDVNGVKNTGVKASVFP